MLYPHTLQFFPDVLERALNMFNLFDLSKVQLDRNLLVLNIVYYGFFFGTSLPVVI